MTIGYSPEFQKAIEPMLPALSSLPQPPVGDVMSRRAAFEGLFAQVLGSLKAPDDVETKIIHITTNDGFQLPIYHITKKPSESTIPTTSDPTSAILYTHGGGYISLSVKEHYLTTLSIQVSHTGVPIFAPEYRLAPEHPFPIPTDDCYAALSHISTHAAEYNIDSARIGIQGDSAGGGLAAGLTLMARDQALSPPLAKQILIYPMIDDRNNKPHPAINSMLLWTTPDNITGWQAYAGAGAGDPSAEISPYAAASRADNLSDLPSTYIDCGTLDLFVYEDMEYASRLARADVEVEVHIYPGVPHAFEAFGPALAVTHEAVSHRMKAVQSF